MSKVLSMKTLIFSVLLFLPFALFPQEGCNADALRDQHVQQLGDYKFIKVFPVESGKGAEKSTFSYVLNGDTKYRLVVAPSGRHGNNMLISIKGRDRKLLATNKDKQKKAYLAQLDFVCPSTGIYFFEASFADEAKDCGILILGFQK